MKQLMLTAITSLLILSSGTIHAYCSKPTTPNCPILDKFNSDFEFQMCKNEIERYIQNMQNYVSCVQRDANQDVEKTVNRFNCIANGGTVCF